MSRTALLPAGLLLLCVLPAAAAAPWAALLLLLPLVAAAWVLRVGVDVTGDADGDVSGDVSGDTAGVTVRSLVGRRHVPWPEVSGLRVGGRGELWLVTVAGTQLRLPVLRLRDLPRLAEASGGRIPASW